jgi:hypothetical protein
MDVLQFISTDKVVEIKAGTAADIGRNWLRFRSRVDKDGDDAASRYCAYSSTLPGNLWLCDARGSQLLVCGEKDAKEWADLHPVFYETATYNINIHFRGLAERPSILHKMKEVCELFSVIEMGGDDYLLTAPLSFLNEPGLFDLSFRYTPKGGTQRTDTFRFRVVSPKLDTKEDYNHILNDINLEYNELVFQYLTKTLQNLQQGGKSSNDVVWLSIFQRIVDEYVKAVNYIVNRPHLSECREVRFSHPDRIRRWTPRMAEQFAERRECGRVEQEFFRHEITTSTHDTAENRFVKFTLDRIGRRLESIFNSIKARNAKAKDEDKAADWEIAKLDEYQKRLRKLAHSPLLRGLHGEPLRQESMVLQKRTGYAQVYRYWLILQSGIELYEGNNMIGVRPIWELYELWCFLKMRQLVGDILGIDVKQPDERFSENRESMLKPFSESNMEHKSTYLHGEDVVELVYQHSFNRNSGEIHTATTDNRPDIVLSIKKKDGFELTYLFDAKYRVTDDEGFSNEDLQERNTLGPADYPPSDAINQMHRYRDAIYYGEKKDDIYKHSAKEIIGGYILFPGRGKDEDVRRRYYFKSIETVNIGAFPLLPDHEHPLLEGTLLREHLEKILLNQTAYEQIKDSIPQRGLKYSSALPHSSELVLVGYYKSDEHLGLILKNKLYYVPIGEDRGSVQMVSGYDQTKYLLLHRGSQRFLYELTGKAPKFYTKEILASLGFAPSRNFYLGFELKNARPIEEIDLEKYTLERQGKQAFVSYFTTFDKIIEE